MQNPPKLITGRSIVFHNVKNFYTFAEIVKTSRLIDALDNSLN